MADRDFGDILAVSLEKLKAFAESETIVGEPIFAPGGLTVIPVSRVSMGMATGGMNIRRKKEISDPGFGAGGGTGMNIFPIAFLMINADGSYELLPVKNPNEQDPVGKITSFLEKTPDIVKKIKQLFTKKDKIRAEKP